MNDTSFQLVAAACQGDGPAASRLIELFYERLYAFLRRLAGNEADAADLTQRTFARVWQALPSFAGRASLSSWMHSIAYRTYVDWLRGNHRPEARSEEWWEAQTSPIASPADEVARADLAARLYAAVDHLEPDQRSAVHLHYYQGLTLEETADATGVATSTVKYRLRQAVEELQSAFKESPLSPLQLSTRR
jgi:RNA polymerase sigma-70 factor (ECF subfamily)